VIGTVRAQLSAAVVAMLTHAVAKGPAELVSVRSKSGHWAHWEIHPGDVGWVDLPEAATRG
jgi:hypothetical protein